MTIKRILIIAFWLIFLASLKVTFAQSRGPSTPDERKCAVEIATLLENDPLNKDEKALSRELLIWLIEVPDIHVKICTNVFGDYSKIKGITHRPLQHR
jgi:hypothetical protein